MIRPLRQRHRIVVLTLSAFLPAVFLLGTASRRAIPLLASSPGGLAHQPAGTYQSVWERDDLWEKSPLRTRLLTDSTQSTLALEVTAPESVIKPDTLLYWVPGNPQMNESLPNDAVLLGSWMQDPVEPLIVPRVAKSHGKLVLYSLADHEIVNVTKPFALQ